MSKLLRWSASTPLVLTLMWVSAGGVASAQSVTAGSIAGEVRDASGGVLPGATVEVASSNLIEKSRVVVTDAQGQYKLVDLPPGTYAVTASLSGFTTVRRDGLQLNAGVTLPVYFELPVGTVDESITVSGASPVVDVQNVRNQTVLTRETLDVLPTGRTIQGYGALTLGARSSGAQDVGGNKGEQTSVLTIHGNRAGDQRYFQDGMSYNAPIGTGQNRQFMVNQLAAQEIVLGTGSLSAESETAGVQINVIPKDGGNVLRSVLAMNGASAGFQGENLSDALQDRGLRSGQSIRKLFDFGGSIGGPILRDRIWFFTAHRWWGSQEYAPGNYFNLTQDSLFYTPDSSRQAYTDTSNEDHGVRLTWQATTKSKLTLSYNFQDNCLCYSRVDIENRAPEASIIQRYSPITLTQVTWTHPSTNRLLWQAGATYGHNQRRQERVPGVSPTDVSITELSTGYIYHARAGVGVTDYGNPYVDQINGRVSMSYVTGSHAFKVGVSAQWVKSIDDVEINSPPVSYAFRKPTPDALPVPQQITQYASPHRVDSRMKTAAAFAQDQWTIRRFTVNAGLRFDYLNGYNPAQTRPGGEFVGALTFDAIRNVPNWKDVSPRIGVGYDIFGNGKTALKLALGRYVIGEATSVAGANNPAASIVTSATRNWNDAFYPVGDTRRQNYVPDCDLKTAAANGECGALSNNGFGTVRIATRYDGEVLEGWGIRPDTWQGSAVLQHELMPGIGLSAGYFRTSYGKFRVTDNLAVTPADFDPFCITAPVDQRLPGGGGGQLCGFYNIKPEAFGRTDNLVTSATKYGERSEVYDGFDLGVSARFRGHMLGGGVSTGRTVTDNCAVIDSPQESRFCRNSIPWIGQTQFKFNGAISLPWSLQASATFQNLPGIDRTVNYVATNAEIAPTLGRNLGSCGAAAVCTGTVTLSLYEPNSLREDRLTQLDLRLSKTIGFGRFRLLANVDVFNVFNASDVLTLTTTYSATNTFWRPTSIMGARLLKLGAQLEF